MIQSLYEHFVLEGVYQETGKKDAAIETLEKALLVAPESQKPFLQRRLDALKGS